MGGALSKKKKRDSAVSPAAASTNSSGSAWKQSEFAKSMWDPPSKLVNLAPDNETKMRLKTWCKQNPAAQKAQLFEVLEMFDEIVKRRVVFQSGQRCGDSLEDGQAVLEANAKQIIEKYLSASATPQKDLRKSAFVGSEFENGFPTDKDLTDPGLFDHVIPKLAVYFEEAVGNI